MLFRSSQPHHSAIAGHIAGHWKVTNFRGFDQLESVLFIIGAHDHCWREADAAPLLNTATGRPYSFDDYPEDRKIKLYAKGVDDIEKTNPYAAWLCSRHFGSFFETAGKGPAQEYYLQEIARQTRLEQQLIRQGHDLSAGDYHFNLLQFCDNLSLFICLNEAGLDQHPWFRDGFAGSEKLGVDSRVLNATWKNQETLKISPFPFDMEFNTDLE